MSLKFSDVISYKDTDKRLVTIEEETRSNFQVDGASKRVESL